MAAAKRKPTSKSATPDPAELLRVARAKLADEGLVKVASLGPPPLRAQLSAQLSAEGFEATKSVVRRPLRAQLAEPLAAGAFLSLKSVGARVMGGSAKEAREAALALVKSGEARVVVRGTEEVLVPLSAPVLSRDELKRFLDFAKKVTKVASSKNGASLLKSDWQEELERISPSLAERAPGKAAKPSNAATAPARTDEQDLIPLFAAVDATRDPATGLSFVPKIVQALTPKLGQERASQVLLQAAMAGVLELRPEGGIQRLSQEELMLCPPGPQGTRLSWARAIEPIRGRED